VVVISGTIDKGLEAGVGVVKIGVWGALVIVVGMMIGGGFPLVEPGGGKHGLQEVEPVEVGPLVVVELLEELLELVLDDVLILQCGYCAYRGECG